MYLCEAIKQMIPPQSSKQTSSNCQNRMCFRIWQDESEMDWQIGRLTCLLQDKFTGTRQPGCCWLWLQQLQQARHAAAAAILGMGHKIASGPAKGFLYFWAL